jgi:hypothetical protein
LPVGLGLWCRRRVGTVFGHGRKRSSILMNPLGRSIAGR